MTTRSRVPLRGSGWHLKSRLLARQSPSACGTGHKGTSAPGAGHKAPGLRPWSPARLPPYRLPTQTHRVVEVAAGGAALPWTDASGPRNRTTTDDDGGRWRTTDDDGGPPSTSMAGWQPKFWESASKKPIFENRLLENRLLGSLNFRLLGILEA